MSDEEDVVEVVVSTGEVDTTKKLEKLRSEAMILSYSNPLMTEALRQKFVKEYAEASLGVLDIDNQCWSVEKFYLENNIVPPIKPKKDNKNIPGPIRPLPSLQRPGAVTITLEGLEPIKINNNPIVVTIEGSGPLKKPPKPNMRPPKCSVCNELGHKKGSNKCRFKQPKEVSETTKGKKRKILVD